MEIERKWLVKGWPNGLKESRTILMRQGYITVRPTVRIRSEQTGETTEYVLCFKGKASADGLSREEIETDISQELFLRLEAFLHKPLIQKEQRRYELSGGLQLEVNQVDAGQPGEFFYAEVEFSSEEQARAWQTADLADYLTEEVTGTPGQSMAAYWVKTRGDMAQE